MFDDRCLPVYLLAVMVVLIGALLSVALYMQQRRAVHDGRPNPSRGT